MCKYCHEPVISGTVRVDIKIPGTDGNKPEDYEWCHPSCFHKEGQRLEQVAA